MENLRERTLSGLFWNLLERVGLRIVQFLPTILLARLLTPTQFGLIGMLSIFIALAQTFLDSGFGLALIQKKEADFTDECSIFYFNIFVGGLAVLLLYFLAPLIAAFYNQPLLTGLMRWLSLSILIQSFSLIQTTLLTRTLDFKTQIKANLSAMFVAGVVGVTAAYLGLGVWSLVIQNITSTALRTLALWWMNDWRPALIFSLAALKSMFRFGSRMLSSSLVATFFDNLYQVFIGKVFSAASLGFYTRAASLKSIVMDATTDSIGRVLFPALATIQDETERLRRAYRQAILLATFVHFPLMIGLIVVARPLIALLFSAQWFASVILFQLMCAAGTLYPLHVINLEILKVKGRSDLFFRLALIKRSLMLVTILITYRWGLEAMLVGQIVYGIIGYALNSYYSERLMSYPMKTQFLDFLPSLLTACLMAGGMVVAGRALSQVGDLILLGGQTLAGVLVYGLVQGLTQTDSFVAAVALARQLPALRAEGGLP